MRLTIHSALGTLLLAGSLGLGGCSSSEPDEEQLEASEDAAVEETTESAEATEEETAATEEGAMEELAGTESTVPDAASLTPVASSMPTTGTTESTRVVRFVVQDKAPIHGAPDAAATAVGKLLKGDRVMVVEEGGWGRIADGMFIKLDALANKAVPRNRQPAAWAAPAH